MDGTCFNCKLSKAAIKNKKHFTFTLLPTAEARIVSKLWGSARTPIGIKKVRLIVWLSWKK